MTRRCKHCRQPLRKIRQTKKSGACFAHAASMTLWCKGRRNVAWPEDGDAAMPQARAAA